MIERNQPIIAKFGGSSMADQRAVEQVIRIVNADPNRRVIVPSAPGKSPGYPEKVTDQLLACDWEPVKARFLREGMKLGWDGRHAAVAEAERDFFDHNESADWRASRGEWLSGRMLADLMGAEFVDATEIIRINPEGTINPASYDLVRQRLAGIPGRVVVPGFYGLGIDGNLQTLPRGGSDITGSVLARGLNAQAYENWTDVNGVMTRDPKTYPDAETIPQISASRMADMARNGASVLHPESLVPIMSTGIPFWVRNTFNPQGPRTLVVTA